MDETREFMYQRQLQRQRGEESHTEAPLEDALMDKARIVRLFYEALLREGFSEEAALHITVSIPL